LNSRDVNVFDGDKQQITDFNYKFTDYNYKLHLSSTSRQQADKQKCTEGGGGELQKTFESWT